MELELPEDADHIGSIIKYITYTVGASGYLYATRLMKLYYQAELLSIIRRGKRLSSIPFHNWNYGPYSREVSLVADSGTLDIKVNDEMTPSGHQGHRYQPSKEKPLVDLLDEEIEILNEVINRWKYKQTALLVTHVKSIPPFSWSSKGEEIDFNHFSRWINSLRNDSSLDERLSLISDNISSKKYIELKTDKDIDAYIESI